MTKFLSQMVRITIILSILFMMHNTYASSQDIKNTTISLNENNASLVDIFNQIVNATNFNFTYGNYIKDKTESYDAVYKKKSLYYVLQDLGKRAKFKYQVDGTDIMVAEATGMVITEKSKRLQRTVTGKVVDPKGVPLPGVNIVEKGTNNGTATDMEGKFKIEVKDQNAILVFSYIGFISKEINVADKDNLMIKLQPDRAKLDEVVVTGYTKKRKADLVGAVSTVDIKNHNLKQMLTIF